MRFAFYIATLMCALVWFANPVAAHDLTITETIVTFTDDGRVQVLLACDLDAIALGTPDQHDHGANAARLRGMTPEERDRRLAGLRAFFADNVSIRFDGKVVVPEVTFPRPGETETHSEISSFLGLTAALSADVPVDARSFTLQATPSLKTVHLTVRGRPDVGGDSDQVQEFRQILASNEESRPFFLHEATPELSTIELAWQYLALGFVHIIPEGLDHILFVLGLFLLGKRLKSLLWQVTAFTIAHSITLGLAMYGVITLSPRIVEPLIALSIAYVAVENVFTSELKPWRPAVVFAFGLLHGLGFAGVLTELGLPQREFALGLATFNVGVELGQLAVILLAMLTIGLFRNRGWYRTRIVIPLSLAIALMGVYWSVGRVLSA